MASKVKISVQNLCEYVLRSGDLVSTFISNARALEGTKAHKKLQKSRSEDYRPEVALSFIIENTEVCLEICGRADGIFSLDGYMMIEEIKTTYDWLEEIDENYNMMHWAQAKCYAYIYASQNDLKYIGVQLTYFQLELEQSKYLQKIFTIEELAGFFNGLVESYLQWAMILEGWYKTRDESIKQLEFPFPAYRQGQREFAVAVYKTVVSGRKLYAEAPTGTGKTIASLFPAVKALGEGQVEKIFYLTAKTITRGVAENAFQLLRKKGLSLKTVTLTAKEKICFRPGTNCDPDLCEFSKGYYDRINQAVQDAFHEVELTREVIENYAYEHYVCPFEFSLDLSIFCDCIICDYNYVFDPRVYLKRFFLIGGDYAFFIDEAHNLVDRAREMFSAELYKQPILDLKSDTKEEIPEISRILSEINKVFIEMRKRMDEDGEHFYLDREPPKDLLYLLRKFVKMADTWLQRNHNTPVRDVLLDLYFTANTFLKVSEFYDERYMTYAEKTNGDVKIKLFCLDPAQLLREMLKKGKSAIFFSATLSPLDYFTDILGGDVEDFKYKLPSPFPQENLCLVVADYIQTTYKTRELTYDKAVDAISAVVTLKKGNYLIYLPSYKYLNEVYLRFVQEHPELQIICQTSGMTDREKEDFLARFMEENAEILVGFAVMGGVFGEGIDLTGDRLSGSVIVGVGLPQVCLERDIIRQHFAETRDAGFEYAYVYPGMNKVLQAAGRVIRTETDRGVVLLLDERFSYPMYRDLFPAHWNHALRVRNAKNIISAVKNFWQSE